MLSESDAMMTDKLKNTNFAIHLAFWTAKPYILSEIIDDLSKSEPLSLTLCGNAIFALIELGSYALAKVKLNELIKKVSLPHTNEFKHEIELLNIAIRMYQQPINKCFEDLIRHMHAPNIEKNEFRILMHLIKFALKKRNLPFIYDVVSSLKDFNLDAETSLRINCGLIAAYLCDNNLVKAGELLQSYPVEILNQELHPLHFLAWHLALFD